MIRSKQQYSYLVSPCCREMACFYIEEYARLLGWVPSGHCLPVPVWAMTFESDYVAKKADRSKHQCLGKWMVTWQKVCVANTLEFLKRQSDCCWDCMKTQWRTFYSLIPIDVSVASFRVSSQHLIGSVRISLVWLRSQSVENSSAFQTCWLVARVTNCKYLALWGRMTCDRLYHDKGSSTSLFPNGFEFHS